VRLKSGDRVPRLRHDALRLASRLWIEVAVATSRASVVILVRQAEQVTTLMRHYIARIQRVPAAACAPGPQLVHERRLWTGDDVDLMKVGGSGSDQNQLAKTHRTAAAVLVTDWAVPHRLDGLTPARHQGIEGGGPQAGVVVELRSQRDGEPAKLATQRRAHSTAPPYAIRRNPKPEHQRVALAERLEGPATRIVPPRVPPCRPADPGPAGQRPAQRNQRSQPARPGIQR
jgi:hypothetical protein